MNKDQIKAVIETIVNYFMKVFFFWYPELEDDFADVKNEFENV